ncbi:7033_t:CDS:1 [Diversispora eburnea]|uniref:7033_t:CDS:1 n=1 Tax=Diversispora eburnea TaxID=1213867 RepID=A0A9N9AYT3_9GLOM|nr:7033_t:CDS:1 [Diversispora eburnea]
MSSVKNNNKNILNAQFPFPINDQNTLIKIPFPPSIREDEIVQLHLDNGIKSVNQTMNAYMIYRKEFNNIIKNYNLELKHISKYSSISWKQEPQYVKKYYKQLSKKVKELFKEKVSSLCFIHSKQVPSTNDNSVSLDTFNSPFPNMNQNFPSTLDDQNFTYANYSNYSIPNMNPLVSDNFENSHHAYMTMNDDELMNYISEDLALTYRAIIQSLP